MEDEDVYSTKAAQYMKEGGKKLKGSLLGNLMSNQSERAE